MASSFRLILRRQECRLFSVGDIIAIPNQFIKLFLGIHPARIGGQQIEQVKLPPGKVHLLGIDENLVVIHADEDTAP